MVTFPGAILFDLDGTLIDSVPDVCASLNRVFAEEGLPPMTVEQVRTLVGHGAMTMIERALAADGGNTERAADILPRFLASYSRNPIENTVIYPGVIEVLDRFAAAGTPMGICTNKPPETADPVIAALDLGRYFRVVSCGDAPHRKPDARHVLMTLEAMHADAANAVFVGDSEADMAAARNANIPAIAVTYGYRQGPAEELGADALIDSFHDLADTLETLARERALP